MNHRLSKSQNRNVVSAFVMSGCANKQTLADFIISLARSQMYMDFTHYKYFIDDSIIFATDSMSQLVTGVGYDELKEEVSKKIFDHSSVFGNKTVDPV
ncbi:hypothetical protein [Aeromonas phage AS-zj]|uniref:Uncharacterized protein n=3 Tax=Caudoviricetes TaxID=2731619 RepID=A0A223LES0_9CAUD|nr:hypothetical protein HWB28_gp069 [Aeromonas phage AS-zj]YP_009835000.1 hypothetical protein HWB29_gp298 [Aeromonas phage AS-sw]ASU00483.1 hypothetical protein [Aeromonas phage AS-zj]ATI18348.1 hypothetical protein [Aeromonas phage AS-sw]UKM62581.1 hypothetical protein P19_0093 [Aeromonas phage P19]